MSKRKNHKPDFKARVALEAIKGEQAVSELASQYGVRPTQIHQLKRSLLDGASEVFARGKPSVSAIDPDKTRDLHAKVGELTVERDFLLKKLALWDKT